MANTYRIGLVPKGDFDSLAIYQSLDLIAFNQEGYVVKEATVPGESPSTHPNKFMKISGKGDKGDAFVYADFTSEQLASLKGDAGNSVEAIKVLDEESAIVQSTANPNNIYYW